MDVKLYLYAAIAAVLIGAGFYGGYRWESVKVDALVRSANKAAIDRLTRVNKDNEVLAAELESERKANAALNDALLKSAGEIKTETITRIEWREREAQNPSCAAWLDAIVPCRLRPNDDKGGGTPGSGEAGTAGLHPRAGDVESGVRGAQPSGAGPPR